jgi:hypothetical protein
VITGRAAGPADAMVAWLPGSTAAPEITITDGAGGVRAAGAACRRAY